MALVLAFGPGQKRLTSALLLAPLLLLAFRQELTAKSKKSTFPREDVCFGRKSWKKKAQLFGVSLGQSGEVVMSRWFPILRNTKPSVRLNDVFLGSRVQGGIDFWTHPRNGAAKNSID